ncbi:hypothetical protein Mgra_00008110, partial [Meloidogyne graminicola]
MAEKINNNLKSNNEKGLSSTITEENTLTSKDLEGSKIANEINSNNNVPKASDLSKMSKFMKNIPRTKEQEEARKAKIIKQYEDKVVELEERKKINELKGMVNEAKQLGERMEEEKKRLNEEKKRLQNEKR